MADPYALSSRRVVHLVRSHFPIGCFEVLTFVHSLRISRYPIPVLNHSDTEEISPQVQPAMLHFDVVGVSCVSRSSRSVLSFLKPGGVIQSALLVQYLACMNTKCCVQTDIYERKLMKNLLKFLKSSSKYAKETLLEYQNKPIKRIFN